MELSYQQHVLDQLSILSKGHTQSILIQGGHGCGKTYLANQFARYKGIADFNVVQPKVADLKEYIDASYQTTDPQVMVIENLDDGVNAAAQVILKHLEEPLPNLYIIVTCINDANLPATILSRCITLRLHPPIFKDLVAYANNLSEMKYKFVEGSEVFKCCKSLTDVQQVLNYSYEYISYYNDYKYADIWENTTDTILWNLSHYPDNTKSNVRFVLETIRNNAENIFIQKEALKALLALEDGRISETAILGRFVINVKCN